MANEALPVYVRRTRGGQWLLRVRVQPGAKRDGLAGMYGERLRIRLAAPAVDNRANLALIDFVAGLLGLKRGQVTLTSGHASREKTLCVTSEAKPAWPDFEMRSDGQSPTEGVDHGSTGPRTH